MFGFGFSLAGLALGTYVYVAKIEKDDMLMSLLYGLIIAVYTTCAFVYGIGVV